jgi:hypothetical protein
MTAAIAKTPVNSVDPQLINRAARIALLILGNSSGSGRTGISIALTTNVHYCHIKEGTAV